MTALIWIFLSLADTLLAALAVISILRHPREPRAMLAWLLAIILLPFVGLALFVLIGEPRLERTRRKRRRRRQHLALSLSKRTTGLAEHHALRLIDKLDPPARTLMRLASRVGSYPPTHSNRVTLYRDEAHFIDVVRGAIDSAHAHIHLEYYIFKPDETGKMIRDALIAKARAGVACRVLLDYIGSWWLSRHFLRPMLDAGVEVAFFLPVAPWQGRWRVNFRNHRKLLVIDGALGFTGSHNIGNEYRGRHPVFGDWQDTNLSIVGPAVQQLQEVFVEDWNYSTGFELVQATYFPPPAPAGDDIVQVVPSGPDTDLNAVHDVVFAALGIARRSICIVMPYFVPDAATLHALQSAAHRGVKVQIIVPARNDAPIALWAGRSFYEELCRTGVEIYEYPLGMLHNKVIVVDAEWSLVGSANMDHRSFRINFELSVLLYGARLAEQLLRDFRGFLGESRRIAPDGREPWSFRESLALGAARLVSPLL
jgi:cardiolipin synthase A/B